MNSGITLPLMNMLTIYCKVAGVEYILCHQTMKFGQAVQYMQTAPILRMIPGGFFILRKPYHEQKNDPVDTSTGPIA
ncbi:hypothetical protein U3G77_25355 [Paenibacillus polymyxa]|uniref:hypothetical protein n=1 Tax=Paenibacillus polymyxa TaxID=1406 RepID=UPI0003F91A9F|nr:hypothetical protein [Paenibacillus polymyxa]WRL61372.1 hypothetical protein U3G77_25355 [Paenibacillus polymyxa]